MSDGGLRLSDVAVTAFVLLANLFAISTLVALLLHRYRSPFGWVTLLSYCRWSLIALGLLGVAAVVSVVVVSRSDAAYAYFIYPLLFASALVVFCALLALPLGP
jgi:hypothetical protein